MESKTNGSDIYELYSSIFDLKITEYEYMKIIYVNCG